MGDERKCNGQGRSENILQHFIGVWIVLSIFKIGRISFVVKINRGEVFSFGPIKQC